MYEELKNLTLERYKKIISKCLKNCKNMPRIADIIAANTELKESNKQEEREIFACKKCDGTGYVHYTKFKRNGDTQIPYVYVARCDCENAKYANQEIPTCEELGIEVSTKINQIKDTQRNIEHIKKDLIKDFTI